MMFNTLLLLLVSIFSPVLPVSFGVITTAWSAFWWPNKPSRWMMIAFFSGVMEDVLLTQNLGLMSLFLLGFGLIMSLTQSILTLRTRWLAVLFVILGETARRVIWQTGLDWEMLLLAGLLAGVGLFLVSVTKTDEAVYLKD